MVTSCEVHVRFDLQQEGFFFNWPELLAIRCCRHYLGLSYYSYLTCVPCPMR